MSLVDFIRFDAATGAFDGLGRCPPAQLAAQSGGGFLAFAFDGEPPVTKTVENGRTFFEVDVDWLRGPIWERAKAARDAAIDGGAPTPAGVVDSDALSRSNITGASIGAMLAQSSGAPFSVEWTLKNNSVVTLDAAQMIALGLAVLAHVNACHDHARALREQIEAAADVTALLQIDVSAGWPG